MKYILLLLFLFCIESHAQNSKVHVKEAGTLSSILSNKEKLELTSLVLSGEINGTDIVVLRKMAGQKNTQENEKGKLVNLDISNVKIIKGGNSYGTSSSYVDIGCILPLHNSTALYTESDILGESMFEDCQLTSIVLPRTLTTIGYRSLSGNNIKSIILPESLQEIRDKAFKSNKITSIFIPQNVTSIGYSPFENCHLLEEITVDKQNRCYISIDGVLFSKDTSRLIQYPNAKKDLQYRIPDKTTLIQGAFAGSFYLSTIILPKSIEEIDWEDFLECNIENAYIPASLKNAEKVKCSKGYFVDDDNPYYTSEYGILYNKSKTTLYIYPYKRTGDFELPNSLRKINPRAFAHSQTIEKLILPDSIEEIRDAAFIKCQNLKSITIPKNTTIIGRTAFRYCINLSDIFFKSTTPPSTVIKKGLIIDNKNCIIHIPKGSLNAYKSINGWENKKFVEY